MTTFNVDSLDFEDDEELRTGDAQDFASRYSSANDRLEIEDLTAGAVAYVPRGRGTDLVGGKFAETVSEGKALADDGNVYDTIQGAVDNAQSWVKVGPGKFKESVTISTAGLTLEGSGDRTTIIADAQDSVSSTVDNLSVSNLSTVGMIDLLGSNCSVHNVSVKESTSIGISVGTGGIVTSCNTNNTESSGITAVGTSVIISNNSVKDAELGQDGTTPGGGAIGIDSDGDTIVCYNTVIGSNGSGINGQSIPDDCIIVGNIIQNTLNAGIVFNQTNCLIVNNRLSNTGGVNIAGTGHLVQDNLTT